MVGSPDAVCPEMGDELRHTAQMTNRMSPAKNANQRAIDRIIPAHPQVPKAPQLPKWQNPLNNICLFTSMHCVYKDYSHRIGEHQRNMAASAIGNIAYQYGESTASRSG
jgi:hypothetical protein